MKRKDFFFFFFLSVRRGKKLPVTFDRDGNVSFIGKTVRLQKDHELHKE